MELFKTEKKAPIKLRGFDFIGYHKDYDNCCYYLKKLDRDNFELMEMNLEGTYRKPEIGAGTKVQIIDAFMANDLYNKMNNIQIKDNKDFIHKVITTSYGDLNPKQKAEFIKKFTSKVPHEINTSPAFKKYIDQGYSVLYCSDDEKDIRKMSIVNIVLVKENRIESVDPAIGYIRTYSVYKPFRYMTTPSYIKGESKTKYFEEELPLIAISHDLLK